MLEVKNVEGYIERDKKVYDLSVKINKMILDFEKDNDVKLVCNGQVSSRYPAAYPEEPKMVLFSIFSTH